MQRSTILQYIYLSQCSLFFTKCSNSDIIRFKASPSLVQRAENMFFNSVYFFNARRSYSHINMIIEMIIRCYPRYKSSIWYLFTYFLLDVLYIYRPRPLLFFYINLNRNYRVVHFIPIYISKAGKFRGLQVQIQQYYNTR